MNIDGSGTADNLEKVRDILFGEEARANERRITRLEGLLKKEMTSIRTELKRRVSALEASTKKDLDSLTKRLKEESTGRREAERDLTAEISALSKELGKKITQLEDQTSRASKDLAKKLADESKALRATIEEKFDGVSEELDEEIAELQDTKADRAALASLFTEFARRLGDNKSQGK